MKFKEHLCLKQDSANISSHDVLIGDIILPLVKELSVEEDYSSSYTPFLVKKPRWNESGMDAYQGETARIFHGMCENYDQVELIPTLCEMFSRALVISAERNFETSNPCQKKRKNVKLPFFSSEYKEAHKNHKDVFSVWRKAGRPADVSHPAKAAVLDSRRRLQKIAPDEEAEKSINLHDDINQS